MLSCLRSVDAQVLTNQEFSAVNLTLHADPFPPIIDGLFAVENPGSLGKLDAFVQFKPIERFKIFKVSTHPFLLSLELFVIDYFLRYTVITRKP